MPKEYSNNPKPDTVRPNRPRTLAYRLLAKIGDYITRVALKKRRQRLNRYKQKRDQNIKKEVDKYNL